MLYLSKSPQSKHKRNHMVRQHWETLGTATLLTIVLSAIAPAPAQSQTAVDLSSAEGGKALVTLTRSQQSYHLENSRFAVAALNTDIPSITPNYQQRITVQSRSSVLHYAIARQPDRKSFVGQVMVSRDRNGNFRSYSIVCENNRPGIRLPAKPRIGTNLRPVCAPGTTPWTLDTIATPAELEATAKQIVGAMTRSQQSYFLENNRFATSLEALELNISPETIGHSYSIAQSNQSAIQYGISQKINLRSYVGAVTIVAIGSGEFNTAGIVCENIQPGTFRPAPPIVSGNGTLSCAPGTQPIGN